MGWPEIVLILIVLLVIFGAGKLPSIGTAIGGGIRELRQAAEGKSDDDTPDTTAAGGTPSTGAPRDVERRDAT